MFEICQLHICAEVCSACTLLLYVAGILIKLNTCNSRFQCHDCLWPHVNKVAGRLVKQSTHNALYGLAHICISLCKLLIHLCNKLSVLQ